MFTNLRAADIPTIIKAQDLRNELLLFSEDSICGPAPGKDDITTIPVKSCANNLSDLLAAPGVSGKTQSGHMQIGEAEVLFNRGGFIVPSQKQVDEFTVCPRHRYLLTYGWVGRKRLESEARRRMPDASIWKCREAFIS